MYFQGVLISYISEIYGNIDKRPTACSTSFSIRSLVSVYVIILASVGLILRQTNKLYWQKRRVWIYKILSSHNSQHGCRSGSRITFVSVPFAPKQHDCPGNDPENCTGMEKNDLLLQIFGKLM